MKKSILLLSLSAFLFRCVCEDNNGSGNVKKKNNDLTKKEVKEIPKNQDSKMGLSQKKHNGVNHYVYKVDLNKDSILIHWKNKSDVPYRSIENVKKHLDKKKHKVSLIVNAGMYEPNNSPKGLYIENGLKQKKLDDNLNYKGRLLNFYMYPNGVFFIDKLNKAKIVSTKDYIEKFQSIDSTIYLASQSGPLLIGNGEFNPAFKPNSQSKNIRNGVGINKKGEIIFITSIERTNFYNFASLFKEVYNCSNALYFDGAISKIYCNGCENYKGANLGPIISVIKKKK